MKKSDFTKYEEIMPCDSSWHYDFVKVSNKGRSQVFEMNTGYASSKLYAYDFDAHSSNSEIIQVHKLAECHPFYLFLALGVMVK